MRSFILDAPGCLEQDRKAWEEVGFQFTDPKNKQEPIQRPDLAIRRHLPDWGQPEWDALKLLFPRMFIFLSEHEILFPDALSAIYNRQWFTGESGLIFTIGSTLEGKIAEPVWEAYRFGGPLTRTEEIKAVADSTYRFLLLDVFRETAEWCGHMSSVVSPS